MRLILLFLGLASFSATAFEFQGTWKGTGIAKTSNYGDNKADPVQLDITLSGSQLTMKDCWNFVTMPGRVCSERKWTLDGTVIRRNGEAIGTYTQGLIEVAYKERRSTVDGRLMIKADGTMSYNLNAAGNDGSWVKMEASLAK